MGLHLVPLVGPFHRRFPRYNAVTILDTVKALAPDVLLTTALAPGAFDEPSWRDVEEPALESVVAWAERNGVDVQALGEPSPDPSALEDFARYLRDAELVAPGLPEVRDAERTLADTLQRALDHRGVHATLLPAVEATLLARQNAFGEGPGTDWLASRSEPMADRISAYHDTHAVLLAPIDHVPGLRAALEVRGFSVVMAPDVPASEAARQRALLDVAMMGEGDDPNALLGALSELDVPEARLAEAETMLRFGDVGAALERLREASTLDLVEPAWLPGWLLTRLGQVADIVGEREEARRAYRGALALAWAPVAAREAATEGLQRPFALPSTPGGDR